ncbi:MAG: sodium/solute symporter [Pseudomonadaceae bacterium]|nr:sodium/solute symporter [Pseudomonadaceae bacterium]
MLDWLEVHWLAVLLFLLYTAMLFANAWIGSRASTNTAGYLVGGRKLGGFVIGVSFFATFASTNSYVGNAGKAYDYGAPWLLMGVMMVLLTLVSWTIVAPRMRRFAAAWDALTLPQLLANRFESQLLARVSGVIVVLSSLLYLLAVFKGAGHLFERFAGIPYEAAVGLTLVIVVAYTWVGGFVSVVRTDVLQGLLMVMGSVLLLVLVVDAAGGFGALGELADAPDTSHLFTLNAGIPFAVLVGIALSGSLKLLVDPRQLARFYGLRDASAVRLGRWVAVVGLAIVMFCLLPVGLFARVLLESVPQTDLVVPMLVSDPSIIPVWAADFLIIAMLAAAMSSLDSVLLVAASVLSTDVLRSSKLVSHTRWAVIGFAVVGAGLALNPPAGIVEITTFSGSLYAVCFLPAVLLGLHWQRGDAVSVLTSMATGVAVLGGWILSGMSSYLHEVFPALATSLVVFVVLARSREPVRSASQMDSSG